MISYSQRPVRIYLYRYLLSSPLLEEVNLEGNWIGEGGAREIMLALQQRKETGLPPLKMSVSPRICPIIFTQIMELNPSSKKKKRGKGKKSKKVRESLTYIQTVVGYWD